MTQTYISRTIARMNQISECRFLKELFHFLRLKIILTTPVVHTIKK